MFHGITFMVENKMCICLGADDILFRIDPSLHEEAIEKNGCRTMEMKGKPCRLCVYK